MLNEQGEHILELSRLAVAQLKGERDREFSRERQDQAFLRGQLEEAYELLGELLGFEGYTHPANILAVAKEKLRKGKEDVSDSNQEK